MSDMWDELEKKYLFGEIVTGLVYLSKEAGFEVDIGEKAFLPKNHFYIGPFHGDGIKLVGKRFEFKIIKFPKNKDKDIIISHKAVILERKLRNSFDYFTRQTNSKIHDIKIVPGRAKGLSGNQLKITGVIDINRGL